MDSRCARLAVWPHVSQSRETPACFELGSEWWKWRSALGGAGPKHTPLWIYAERESSTGSGLRFPEAPELLRQAVLRFYWDGKDQPSIQVPLGDFFGAGFGLYEHYISLPLSMTSGGYNCYWQMPFRKGVRITVTNESGCRIDALYYNIDIEQVPRLAEDTLYFHAEWRRENPTQPGKNYTVLETKGQGHFVGLLMEMQDRNGGFGFLEGDERVFVDGESKPSINGTGTEDYFNSGWYFNRGTFSAPYHGLILIDEDLSRVCAYRWHILDPIPFKRSLRFTIEHGHNNEVETRLFECRLLVSNASQGSDHPPPGGADGLYPATPHGPRRDDRGRKSHRQRDGHEWEGSDPEHAPVWRLLERWKTVVVDREQSG